MLLAWRRFPRVPSRSRRRETSVSCAALECLEARQLLAAPALSGIPSSVTYGIGSAGVPLAPAASLSNPNNVYSGAALSISCSDAKTTDRLTVYPGNGVTIVGSAAPFTIAYNSNAVATFSGPAQISSTPLQITFTSKAGLKATQTILQQIIFYNTSSSVSTATRHASLTYADGQGRASPAVAEAVKVANVPVATTPEILLTPDQLNSLKAAAAANTPQWKAFVNRLNSLLNQVIGPGEYQGSQLTLISDYALAYQVLKDNPDTLAAAQKYADKALGLLQSGLHDYMRGDNQAMQFLARGDASSKTYTLPGAGIIGSSVQVFVAPIKTYDIVHGKANGADEVDDSLTFIKVSKTPDGAADYPQGTSWLHNPDLPNVDLDWSLAGAEPGVNKHYYVTAASSFDADSVPRNSPDQPGGLFYTLSNGKITFNKAPGQGLAIYVEYVYGVHAADGSTLAYQQTSAGDGGFDSIFVDTSYPSRYLGKHVAMGFDWLYGYQGFTPALKQETASLLVRWSDYVKDHGYYNNSPASNYGAGGYDSRVMTAVALSGGRDPVDDPRLIAEVQSWRDQYVKPLLTNPATSVQGGFWAEGWNYGALATQNILLAEKTLETAGLAKEADGISPGAEEKTWAGEVLTSLISEQASRPTVYDAGDGYDYPLPFPNKNLIDVLTDMTTDPALKSYGNYILQKFSIQFTPDFVDLLTRDPTATAKFWSNLPLQYVAGGQGLVTARNDWNYNSPWVSLQIGNLVQADHQGNSPGMMEISRGADQLLVNAQAVSGYQDPNSRSQYANMVVIDSHNDVDADGNLVQTYPFSTGSWYGTKGVSLYGYEATAGYVYAAGDYKAAYSNSNHPGDGGPATKLTRQMIYLRPNVIIVHDRVGTLKADYTKQLRWNFLNAPTVTGNTFLEQVGGSKLFGATFSDAALSTSVTPYNTQKDGDGNVIDPVGFDPRPFYELVTENQTATASLTYTTAFQTTASSVAAMSATSRVVSADGQLEGVQSGQSVALFGKNGLIGASTTKISYTLAGPTPVSTVIVDLRPGQTYQVTVNGLARTFTASAQGTISFAG